MKKDNCKCCTILCKNLWAILTVFALLLCVDIEYKIWCPILLDETYALAGNRLVLALSYSYIAAAIFHYFVNIIPIKRKKRLMDSLIHGILWKIQELLRQSKNSIISPFDLNNKVMSKVDYINAFSNKNLNDKHPFMKDMPISEKLYELSTNIHEYAILLISYRDYLSDENLSFINNLINSPFLSEPIILNNQEINEELKNQDRIGESIYNLYEEAKKTTKPIKHF